MIIIIVKYNSRGTIPIDTTLVGMVTDIRDLLYVKASRPYLMMGYDIGIDYSIMSTNGYNTSWNNNGCQRSVIKRHVT